MITLHIHLRLSLRRQQYPLLRRVNLPLHHRWKVLTTWTQRVQPHWQHRVLELLSFGSPANLQLLNVIGWITQNNPIFLLTLRSALFQDNLHHLLPPSR